MTIPPYAEHLPLTRKAIAAVHERRPPSVHELEVGSLLYNRGYDDQVVAAGILHETLASGALTEPELAALVGERCRQIVVTVSAGRHALTSGSADAHAVHAADLVSATRELRAAAAFAADEAATLAAVARIGDCMRGLALLERLAPRLPLTHQLRFELWALARVHGTQGSMQAPDCPVAV